MPTRSILSERASNQSEIASGQVGTLASAKTAPS